MLRYPFAVAVTATLGILLLLFWRQNREIDRLKARQGTERQRTLEAVDRASASAALAAANARSAQQAAAEAAASVPPQLPATAARTPEVSPIAAPAKQVTALGEEFAAEPYNASWAAGRADVLNKRLAAVMAGGSQVKRVECRSSVCRVETEHDDRAAMDKFLDGAIKNVQTKLSSGALSLDADIDASGHYSAVIFVAEEGQGFGAPALHQP